MHATRTTKTQPRYTPALRWGVCRRSFWTAETLSPWPWMIRRATLTRLEDLPSSLVLKYMQRIRGFHTDELYKFTFLLTYLLSVQTSESIMWHECVRQLNDDLSVKRWTSIAWLRSSIGAVSVLIAGKFSLCCRNRKSSNRTPCRHRRRTSECDVPT